MAISQLGRIEALDRAAAEVAREVEYYASHGGPDVARAFLEDFALAARRIVEAPRSFPAWPRQPGVRRALLARYPFAVGFVIGEEGTEEPPLVVVVAHGRRRPGYWFTRVK